MAKNRVNGSLFKATGIGDGQFDAFMNAVKKIYDNKIVLLQVLKAMASKGVSKILGFVFLGFILMGCGDYAKILKSPDNDLKFKAAKTYYDNTKFDKALPLFENSVSETCFTAA